MEHSETSTSAIRCSSSVELLVFVAGVVVVALTGPDSPRHGPFLDQYNPSSLDPHSPPASLLMVAADAPFHRPLMTLSPSLLLGDFGGGHPADPHVPCTASPSHEENP